MNSKTDCIVTHAPHFADVLSSSAAVVRTVVAKLLVV